MTSPTNAEETRLHEARTHTAPWKKWGPYLSERQWGTVREDYSQTGTHARRNRIPEQLRIRSLSRHHLDTPYSFVVSGSAYRVSYEPAESTTGLFGGNSNWRGPIWML
jgi:hypothetical protein